MKKIFKSLLTRYIVLILMAMGFIQIIMVIYMFSINFEKMMTKAETLDDIEAKWTSTVHKLAPENIQTVVEDWHTTYPDAGIIYVNGQGELQQTWYIKDTTAIPAKWDMATTTRFIQMYYNHPTFTVVRFIGDDEEKGLLILQVDRATFSAVKMESNFLYIASGALLLFLALSLFFFIRILKRLVHLEEAMTIREVDGLPIHTKVTKRDEIGAVEIAFNNMVDELREAKQREEREEQLRRELVANLSHDLKTPLTKMRAQLQYMPKEQTASINYLIDTMSELIENLMAYSLLTADKMQYHPVTLRVDRLVTESMASWYPVFEEQDFEVDLQTMPVVWLVDKIWLQRILDNLLQNVLRHASSGKYVSVTVTKQAIIIRDKGQGFEQQSHTRGAGIGLSIVQIMSDKMDVQLLVDSTQTGTTITLTQ